MFNLLFKKKDKISERNSIFYDTCDAPYKFKVLITCHNDNYESYSIELESVSTHHFIKHKCQLCGEDINDLAPVEYMYLSDCNKYETHTVQAIDGVQSLRDNIVTSFWEF